MPTIQSRTAFTDETFKKADLAKQVIKESTFSDCAFVGCTFSETAFKSCRFIECTFDDCTMKLANVENTTFSRVKFTNCHLLGVNWAEANWSEWASKLSALEFENCVLEYGTFLGLELKKLRLKDCNAREVNFSEADLTEADFSGTDFEGAVFLKANITKANFVGAKNYALNLKDIKSKGARFSLPEAVRLLHYMDIELVDPLAEDRESRVAPP